MKMLFRRLNFVTNKPLKKFFHISDAVSSFWMTVVEHNWRLFLCLYCRPGNLVHQGRDVDWSICKGYPEEIIKTQSSNIIQNQAALTVLHWRIRFNSVVRRRKDSSWESTPNICKSSGVGNIDHNPNSTTATGSLHGTVISPVLSPS